MPAGRTVQHQGDIPGARKMEAQYEDTRADAAAIKSQAMKVIADAIKTGEYELPFTEQEKEQLAQERAAARAYQTANAPRGVRPSEKPSMTESGGEKKGPSRRNISQQTVTIPNYNTALDYACTPRNQRYALISYLGPRNCRPIGEEYAFRIWGVFATIAEATEYAEYIRQTNRYAKFYDIIAAEIGGWTPFPPILDEIEQHKFQNDHLQDFHDTHMEQQKKAQHHHQQRMEQADDINPEIEHQRKLRAETKKLRTIMERKAAVTGRSVEELLAESGNEVLKSLPTETGDPAATGPPQQPAEQVTFEQRRNADGSISTIKKTRRRRRRN